MFQDRQWPEGFEFPACDKCNSGSSDHDLVAAMLARMDAFRNQGNRDGRSVGLMKLVNKQFPSLLERMLARATEARRSNRELGLRPEFGRTHQETGVVKVTDEMHQAVCVLAKKLSKGVFYRESSKPFPDDGCLLLNWFTNADFLRDGKYIVFDLLKHLNGDAPALKRGGKYLNDQFEYKLSISPDKDILVLQAMFSTAFGFVVFGSSHSGQLEAVVTRLREQSNREGPFAVLQSATLSTANET